MLGQPPHVYCKWITDPRHWGGYIEMEILSGFFEIEIAVIHIRDCTIVPVNSCRATRRIYILYDGVHYDSIVFRRSRGDDQAIVACNDKRAANLAVQMGEMLQLTSSYASDRTHMVQCEQCAEILTGEREAERHYCETGHFAFTPCAKF
jgi:ubiquitin thioesterase OTU1